eukprot:TRINITY_DN1138_c0_g3_i2.p2 TRINITY_DN1138_c0_g3~~TRINITY_DN1138_c0_g3_i2.p2  ORF type:complete len:161 (-),score=34.00 TRINITY_DN1138_c0_g3_i2:191-673(-)
MLAVILSCVLFYGQVGRLTGHSGWVRTVRHSSDGRFLLSGGSDCAVVLWDLATRTPLRTFPGHSDVVRSVELSPNGKFLISGSSDSTIRFWEVANGTCRDQWSTGQVYCALTHPDGERVVAALSDKTITTWHMAVSLGTLKVSSNSNSVAEDEDGNNNND